MTIRSLSLLSALFLAPGLLSADPIIMVFPTIAPNAYGSPSYAVWQANAMYALEHGLSSYGDPNSPTYYRQIPTATTAQVIVTGFPSWMGLASPGSVFGSAYANELGNRVHFSAYIDGNGTQFSISQLSFQGVANPAGTNLDWGWGEGEFNYSAGYVGEIDTPGGPQYITSGPNTQLVDRLYTRGPGNSLAAYCPGCTVPDQQAAIEASAGYGLYFSQLAGTFSLNMGGGNIISGSGTFDYQTPEPGTLATAGIAIFGIGLLMRKRSRG